MSKRESIAKLAKTNFKAALKYTTSIPEVGKRIQALGWVARYAPAAEVQTTVDRAVRLAFTPTDDAYEPLLALAWPLRALYETKNIAAIPKVLNEAIKLAPSVEPTSSRAEALVQLIHATLPAGTQVANPAIDALINLCSGDDHWRIVRAFADTAVLVNATDKVRALQIARAMPEGKKREAAIARLKAGETSKAFVFYW